MPFETEKHPNEKQTLRQRLDKRLLAVRQTPQVIQMAWRSWPAGTIIVPFGVSIGFTAKSSEVGDLSLLISGWFEERDS